MKPMKHIVKFSFICIFSLFLSACQSFVSSGGLLFQDTFEAPYKGWSQSPILSNGGQADFVPGAFRFYVNVPHSDSLSTPGISFADTRVEVDATRQAGPDINRLGVICRYQDAQNYYFFIISSDGFYSLGKVKEGAVSLFGMDQMQRADVIQPGTTLNHLRADCADDILTFYINGRQVAQVQDGDFSKGDVGILAGTFDEAGVDVLFDNFVVLKP
jgi:hypothetical protein